MLPDVDGLTIVRTLRAANVENPNPVSYHPVGGIDDRVNGLNAGADDYLVKPFVFSNCRRGCERAAAGVSRTLTADQTGLKVADLEVDVLKRAVRRVGPRDRPCNPREFQLLEYLIRHAGQVVTRTMLLERVWDYHFDPRTNVVESHLSRLRTKVDKGFTAELIHTVRGAGYCLRAPE